MTNLSFTSTVVLASLACSSLPEANGYSPTTPLRQLWSTTANSGLANDRTYHRLSHTLLYAKKPAKKNKNRNKSPAASEGGGGGGGAGFGRAGAGAASPSAPKVRSVSGHAGSGEKPLRQAANTFDAIIKEHGKESVRDVYCYSPLDHESNPDTFWFVGKIAVSPGTQPHEAVLSQKRLILEYSKRELRPQNLGGKFAPALELWLAPGDSEMDAVQNKVDFVKVDGTTRDLPEDFDVREVGYNPEIYVGDEVTKGGLRVKRDPATGKPIKPVFEVNQSM